MYPAPLGTTGLISPSAASIQARRTAARGSVLRDASGRSRQIASVSRARQPQHPVPRTAAPRCSSHIPAATGNAASSEAQQHISDGGGSASMLAPLLGTAALLPGPLRDVPCLLLQAWLGQGTQGQLQIKEIEYGLRDTPGLRILLAGTRVDAGSRTHAALALLLVSQQQLEATDPLAAAGAAPVTAPVAAPASAPGLSAKPGKLAAGSSGSGTSAAAMAQFEGSRLHWGSVRAPGAKWQAPEPGWHTFPEDSTDAGGGAWQSTFQPLQTPAGMVHALLLQLPADEGAPQAIAAIVKAPGNRWLGDAVTRRDFCFDFSELPKSDPMKGPEEGKAENTDTSVETAAVADDDMSTASAARATEVADALAGVGSGQALLQLLRGYGVKKLPTRLDAAELARPPPPTGGGAAAAEAAAAAAARRATAQRAGLPQQPELPPPWAEGPPRDKTQVVTLTGDLLAMLAEMRLKEWVKAQEGLKPLGEAQALEFPVEGFAAPLAGSMVALVQQGDEASSTGSGPLAAVCLVADEGLAGAPKGLVLHWSAASSVSSNDLAEELPHGWCTVPDVSWDVGRWCWATPFEHCKAGEQDKLPAGCYYLIMVLPLKGVFGAGGRLVFELRTSKGQWLRNGATGASFILHLDAAAKAAGLTVDLPPAAGTKDAAGPGPTAPEAPPSPISKQPGSEQPVSSSPTATGAAASAAGGVVSSEPSSTSVPDVTSATARTPSSKKGDADEEQEGQEGKEDSGADSEDLKWEEATATAAADAAWDLRLLLQPDDKYEEASPLGPVASDVVDQIRSEEHRAERSLMHRFGIATEILKRHGVGGAGGEKAARTLTAVAVWLRFSSLRLLRWNVNYNVKPREISAALDGLGDILVQAFESGPPSVRGISLLALTAAGRGGQGALGQRIRDEILTIQHRSGTKGGMMEQWHQKLHNNSSPDDVVICQALLAYIRSGLDLSSYWSTLKSASITAERLASFDRAITHEPSFTPAQAVILEPDLVSYLATLEAVHGGADLRSAAEAVLGYERAAVKGKLISVEPVPGVATPQLKAVLRRLMHLQQEGQQLDSGLEVEHALSVMRLAVRARRLLAKPIAGGNSACGGRLKDCLFLDVALATCCRNALESVLHLIGAKALETELPAALRLLLPAAENVALGMGGVTAGAQGALRYEMVLCTDQLRFLESAEDIAPGPRVQLTLSVAERISRLLSAAASATQAALQPTADALGSALRIGASSETGSTSSGAEGAAAEVVVDMLSEEEVRSGPAAALSNVLAALQPRLLSLAGASGWQVISRGSTASFLPVSSTAAPSHTISVSSNSLASGEFGGHSGGKLQPAAVGKLLRVESLMDAPAAIAAAAAEAATPGSRPLLLVERMRGEEDVPSSCGGVVVLGHCPDVLCHAAVRARSVGVPLVACLDSKEAARVAAMAGKYVSLQLRGEAVELVESSPPDATSAPATALITAARAPKLPTAAAAAAPSVPAPAKWCGRWVVPLSEFEPGVVGAKSANTLRLSRRLPAWLLQPQSAAVPFGAFEEGVMAEAANAAAVGGIRRLEGQLVGDVGQDAEVLTQIRAQVMLLQPPAALREALAQALPHLLQHQGAQQQQSIDAAQLQHQQQRDEAGRAGGEVFDSIWQAVLRVWASQWGAGAEAALRQAALPRSHLRMGVLLQPVVPVRYAFVAHTRSPTTGQDDEVYVEVVPGLGEALVSGDYSGRSLGGAVSRAALEAALAAHAEATQPSNAPAATGQGSSKGTAHEAQAGKDEGGLPALLIGAVRKVLTGGDGGRDGEGGARGARLGGPLGHMPGLEELRRSVRVASYPSKSYYLPAPTGGGAVHGAAADVVMARSDSNAEDLPGCSGAGLFESHATSELPRRLTDYTSVPICCDEEAALRALWCGALVAVAAEKALAGGAGGERAQDVEGGIDWQGNVWALQSRDQM